MTLLADQIETARQLVNSHNIYRGANLSQIVDIPLSMGNGVLIGDWLYFSHMRPTGKTVARLVTTGPVYESDWLDEGPVLWIMDFAPKPGVPIPDAYRAVLSKVISSGLCEEGDWVYYRRNYGDRFGKVRARHE